MPRARKQQIALSQTSYYHLVSRCVRRAFLCGITDTYNFEHRREWMTERLALLTQMFAIDIAAYALMTNHYHLVVRVDTAKAKSWSKLEVLQHWQMLFHLPALVERELSGGSSGEAERQTVDAIIEKYRDRLCDISWFMRCLNEHIARLANVEDECTGRFWEGRFKCQALLGEKALLSVMAYVDLNPMRAKIAESPQASEYTSIQNRLGNAIRGHFHGKLLPFSDDIDVQSRQEHIPYRFKDYLELLDWTGQHIHPEIHILATSQIPPTLISLGIAPNRWLHNCRKLEQSFHFAIGPSKAVKQLCQAFGQHWFQGQVACRRCFG